VHVLLIRVAALAHGLGYVVLLWSELCVCLRLWYIYEPRYVWHLAPCDERSPLHLVGGRARVAKGCVPGDELGAQQCMAVVGRTLRCAGNKL
jgi:hypothetical protein